MVSGWKLSPWCPRCGLNLPASELPCKGCWEGPADEATVALLVADIERIGRASAWSLLARVRDPAGAALLRDLAGHADANVRSAAVHSLGRRGGPDDVPRIASLLADSERDMREAARSTLARIGDRAAADALATSLDHVADEERVTVAWYLAKLGDARAVQPLWEALPGVLEGRHGDNVTAPLIRVGSSADRHALVDIALRLAREAVHHPAPSPEFEYARRLVHAVVPSLHDLPGEYEAAVAQLKQANPSWVALLGHHRRDESTPEERTFKRPRTVPRRTMARFGDAPSAAKFGGQPDWIGEPAWPVTADGRPLTFYGQMPLTRDDSQIAYIFISLDERAETYEQLGQGNAVVIQPGNRCHLDTIPAAEGPRLYSRYPIVEPHERFVVLEDGADPERWEYGDPLEQGDWNKIGGTGLFLQDDLTPREGGWRFALEFSATWAWEDLADGAHCYVCVRDDGLGSFGWDCH